MPQAYEAALRAAADLYAAGDLGGAKEALERLVLALTAPAPAPGALSSPAPGQGPYAERARLYLGWVRRCLRVSASAATPTQDQALSRPAAAPPPPSEISLLDLDEDPVGGLLDEDLLQEEPPGEIALGEDLIDLSALLATEGRIPPTESNLSLLLSDLPLVESSAPPPSPPLALARALDPDQTPVQTPVQAPLQTPVQAPIQAPGTASSGLSALLSDTPLAGQGRSDLSVLLSDRPVVPAAPASSLSGLLSDTPATATAAGGISTRTAPPRGDGPGVPQGPSVLVADDLILAEDLDDEPVFLDETGAAAGPPLEFEPAPLEFEAETESVIEIGDEDDVFGEALAPDAAAEITQEGPAAPPEIARAPEIAAPVPEEIPQAASAPRQQAAPAAPRALEILHPLYEAPRRTGATPDLAVEFEDIVAEGSVHLSDLSTGSPMSFPPPPPRSSVDAVLDEVQRHISRGDRQGGLQLLEQVLREEADGDPGAPSLRPYQARLAGLYESLLGPLDRLARAGRLPRDLEPSSAFLLSLLDGSMTLEEALMVSGLDRLRGARTLALLIGRGLVKIG